MATPSGIPAIELRGLNKSFGEVRANAEVSLCIHPGTIHGIVGENGAGKSTAMKMLYGIYPPDAGEILLDGKIRQWKSPADAIAAGVGMVHQHFMLAGPYTALENIILGAEPGLGGRVFNWLPPSFRPIDRRGVRARLDQLAWQYKLSVDWDKPVERLSVGIQQRVEILKLLYRDARILILDEPTAVLTPQETSELFNNLRKLRDEGKTILIITHKLKEVMAVTDHISVFRAGRVTGEVETAKTSPQQLAEMMVGRKVVLQVQAPEATAVGANALEVTGLSLAAPEEGAKARLAEVSLRVQEGEIVGIAGVEGNGQSELMQALLHPCDPQCRTSGRVRILEKDVTALAAREIRDLGVGLIPEDRHREGVMLERPVRENFLLGLHRRPEFLDAAGMISNREVDRSAGSAMEVFDIRPRSLTVSIGGLSGGNQQKLVIAREFQRAPRLLIAAQPTRGVDVGAIEFIHGQIFKARSEGAGVLLVSSELDEILTLSDRILVMYEGRIVAEFIRGSCDERTLGLCMSGAKI